jgi:hypothetical protein
VTYTYQAGPLSAFDDFASMTAGTALNGRTAPIGGSWATSGTTGDFVAADGPAAADETVKRSTSSDASVRYAILGSTTFADTDVSVDTWVGSDAPFRAMLLLARWSSSSMHLYGAMSSNGVVTVGTTGAGSLQTQLTIATPLTGKWLTLRLVVFASGRGRLTLSERNGAVLGVIDFMDASLATGGALASGKVGIGDKWGFAIPVDRFYDNFAAAVPPAEPIVCYSGQSIEFRSDATLREDSTGTYSGPPPSYIGSRFFVPNAGGPGRKARVAVIARRNDITVAADDDLTGNATMDATTVAVYVTPRYLAIPRG